MPIMHGVNAARIACVLTRKGVIVGQVQHIPNYPFFELYQFNLRQTYAQHCAHIHCKMSSYTVLDHLFFKIRNIQHACVFSFMCFSINKMQWNLCCLRVGDITLERILVAGHDHLAPNVGQPCISYWFQMYFTCAKFQMISIEIQNYTHTANAWRIKASVNALASDTRSTCTMQPNRTSRP